MEDWTEGFFGSAWQEVQLGFEEPEVTATMAKGVVELLGLSVGDRVLDVPCGNGRLSRPLAALGMKVTGVDFTEAFLTDGRRRASEAGLDVDLRQGDMRELDAGGGYDAVLNVWGSFGYFDDETDEAVLAGFARELRPGGALLVEVPPADRVLPQFRERSWSTTGDVKVLEEREWNAEEGRVEVVWTFVREGRAPESHRSSIRVYTVSELMKLCRRVGFSDVVAYQDLEGTPYALEGRLCLVARTPSSG